VATADNFKAAFLGRSGRRGFGEVFGVAGEAEKEDFDFWASPSRTLTDGAVFCDVLWVGWDSREGNSAEMEVSAPPLLRGGGKEVGRE
jgi:hypothetical protein